MANCFKKVFVSRVIDGDTIVVRIPDTYPVFGQRIPVRVAGINCPEIGRSPRNPNPEGIRAKQFTERFVRKTGYVDLLNVKRGKYFRLVADVQRDGKDLATELLKVGYAEKQKCFNRKRGAK